MKPGQRWALSLAALWVVYRESCVWSQGLWDDYGAWAVLATLTTPETVLFLAVLGIWFWRAGK